nr:UDP-N-acetylmuramoyl-L-alanyl-D-glutamate--2,6-diaminopimelate ligase [Motilibacter deserti]
MPARSLAEAAARVAAALPEGADPELALSGVTLRSGDVRPGDLYAALPGSAHHGAEFAAAAVEAGAVAVLTDPDGAAMLESVGVPVLVADSPRAVLGELAAFVYGNPAEGLLLLGVTGTSGKTTTAYLLEAGLRAAGHTTGLIGTVETRIGDEALASTLTTPEAPDLQALFAVMRERGVTAVAMEVSSHALALGRVDGTVFDVAAFTNLGRDHLDFHPDLESYFLAKASLFTPARARAAVVTVDGEHGVRLVGLAAEAGLPVTTVTTGSGDAAWRAADVEVGPEGSRLRALGPDEECELVVGLPGAYNVANGLLALAALDAAGVPAKTAAPALAAVRVPGRMERVPDAGTGIVGVVDYAHKPDAVEAALSAVRAAVAGRVLVVLGAGGDRDREKRPLMGEAAARRADVLVVTDDNPRSERPGDIRSAVLAGARGVPLPRRAVVLELGDRRGAIRAAVGLARPGDAVVVLGKGHERGQSAGGVVTPFDDRDELADALEALASEAAE